MKLGCSVLLTVLIFLLPITAVASEIYGNWVLSDKACNCGVVLSIQMWEDGSPIGSVSFPDGKHALHNILLDGNHVSFSVDRTVGGNLVTYDYDAQINDDVMTGTWTAEDNASGKMAFNGTRLKK